MQGALVVLLAAAWLAVGACVGVLLRRDGHPIASAVAAVVAWPAMVSALGADVTAVGPYSDGIARAFSALRTALLDPGIAGAADLASLDGIEASLRRADQRIAAVDRLLDDPAIAADPSSAKLREARARAGDEVDAVLKQLVTVRVQLGLVALAGDTSSVRAHLVELAARARALEEVEV